jgi:hypothetical protein
LGIGTPLFSIAGAAVVLRTMILAGDRAHAADVLVRFSSALDASVPIGFHLADKNLTESWVD